MNMYKIKQEGRPKIESPRCSIEEKELGVQQEAARRRSAMLGIDAYAKAMRPEYMYLFEPLGFPLTLRAWKAMVSCSAMSMWPGP